ncbi:uncharacterized protein LOC119732768 [Patiria miniata]|uniref:DUF4806 domain-containing protein n=1 Tax=Patiria miniata TaxID=46514 RepID=A0A914AG03_PATMI|nr:uncharacterized protein LOC119732768 [Patiria miniata]
MFIVVVFPETEEVELIPDNWLLKSQNKALWPPFRSLAAISKAVRDKLKPDLMTWESFRIRVLYRCETYEEGHRKAKLAEETSDLQTAEELEDGQKKTRKRRRPVQWTSSDEDSDGDSIKQIPSSAAKAARPLPPPRPTPPPRPQPPSVPTPPSSLVHSSGDRQQQRQQQDPLMTTGASRRSSGASEIGATVTPRAILKAVCEVQVMAKTFLEQQELQNKLLHQILRKIGDTSTAEDFTLPENLQLPLGSIIEVENIEEQLQQPDFKASLGNYLSKIGGSDLKEVARRIMTNVFSHEVALKFNWAGKVGWKGNGEVKRAFNNLALCASITSKYYTCL